MKKVKESLNNFSRISINLNMFNKLNINEQNEKLKDTLADAYGGRTKVKSESLLKIINLAKEKEKKTLHIENRINIENNGTELLFGFTQIKVLPSIIFYVSLLIFLSCAATFAYLGEEKQALINIDLNGDGIADINIDLNKDGIADVNIDINNDKKPDQNIDYMANWTSTFNMLKGNKLINKINQDLNKDGKCDLNCDINNDGWPELNIDLNGDGIADMFLDKENQGFASMNIDSNGDGVCDIQCDNDFDGKCDTFCLMEETIKYLDYSELVGNNNLIGSKIPTLTIEGEEIICNNLYPTDQKEEGALKECNAKLTIRNLSSLIINYKVIFRIDNNSYTSENFKYKMIGTNGGGRMNNYETVPKKNTTVFESVKIASLSSHVYNISFILEGTNTEQNYDANQTFKGLFKIALNK